LKRMGRGAGRGTPGTGEIHRHSAGAATPPAIWTMTRMDTTHQ
jgi:hypothetical protein